MFKHKYNNLRIYFESSTVISSLLWRLTNINTECTDFAALCSSSSADKFYTHADLIFQQDLTPADSATQTAKATTKCLLTMLLLWLTDQPNHQTWTPRGIWGILPKGRRQTPDKKESEGCYQSTLGSINTSPWITSMPHSTDAVIHVKGAQSKETNILFRSWTFVLWSSAQHLLPYL